MQSKSRIASLNEKGGSVRNIISAFEHTIHPDDNQAQNVVIEGDSKGIVGLHYPPTNSRPTLRNPFLSKHEEQNQLENRSLDESVKLEINLKAEDQINSIIDDYQKQSPAPSKTDQNSDNYDNDEGIPVDVDSSNTVNIVDFKGRGVKQTVDTPQNNLSSRVMFENPIDQTSSVYDTESETNPKQVTNPTESPKQSSFGSGGSKQSSTWKDGEMLLKTFGYNNSSSNKVSTGSPEGQDIEAFNDLYDNTTLKASKDECGELTHHNTIDRKKASSNWQYGDIDGLERASMKTASISESFPNVDNVSPNHINNHISPVRTYYSPHLTPNNNSPFNGNLSKTISPTQSRTRSVSFKESENKTYYPSNEPLDPPSATAYNHNQKGNPWKYVCFGILVTTALLYILSLTFKEFFSTAKPVIILTENDVLDYFDKISNNTRSILLSQLSTKYNLSSPLLHDNTTYNNQTQNENRIRYAPRENDKDIKVVTNSFENINPVLKQDAEIMEMMTTDDLKFMFAGIAYAPNGVMEPDCGANLRDVMLDIARMSKVTGSVKTYGTQCNQAGLILQAIEQLQVNFTLSLGVWIGADEATNQIQLQELRHLVQSYPRKYFKSIFIGNEVIYRNEKTIPELLEYIRDTKEFLQKLNITDLPVGTSEIGSMITKEMFVDCDFVGANIHPFFGGIDAQFGTRWVLDYYHNQLLPLTDAQNTSQLIISEVGWPYQGGEFIRSVAGSWEYQQFLNDWLCTTPANILNECFFFEAFDEPWKKIWWDENRTWETEWGFFTSDRKMKKHIYIPDCSKYGNPSFVDFDYIENIDDPYAGDNDYD